ncbi:MAG: glycosyltransferase family 39 protein [Pseudomonadota bacterium]|nr:glycosyltransferase family 39 protein [Pseudomonadota bacterium]
MSDTIPAYPTTDVSVRTTRVVFLTFVLLVVVYRVVMLLALDVPLFYDEAYYFGWAQELAFGYFSKPPMVAWSIALTTIATDSSWAVRLSSPLFYAVAAIFVWRTSLLWFDEKSAAWAGGIFLTLPLVGFNSMFVTTDAPLLCFWCASLWALSHALQSDRLRFWLLTGLFCGLGLMSKYSMGILLLGALTLLLWVPEYRKFFVRPGPYLGALLAALVFLPNVLWNVNNEFVSLKHTAEISQLDRSTLNFAGLLEFAGAQLICLGPWFLWLLRPKAHGSYGLAQSGYKFALCLSVAFFLVIGLQALLSRANANWAAPGFAGVAMLLGVAMARLTGPGLGIAGMGLNMLLILTLQFYHPLLGVFGVQPAADNDPYKRVSGWREGVYALQSTIDEDPTRLVVSNSRFLLANFEYYLNAPQPTLLAWDSNGQIDNHYELRASLADYSGANVLFVARNPLTEMVLQRFQSSRVLAPIEVPVYRDLTRRLYVYQLNGFKGYP